MKAVSGQIYGLFTACETPIPTGKNILKPLPIRLQDARNPQTGLFSVLGRLKSPETPMNRASRGFVTGRSG